MDRRHVRCAKSQSARLISRRRPLRTCTSSARSGYAKKSFGCTDSMCLSYKFMFSCCFAHAVAYAFVIANEAFSKKKIFINWTHFFHRYSLNKRDCDFPSATEFNNYLEFVEDVGMIPATPPIVIFSSIMPKGLMKMIMIPRYYSFPITSILQSFIFFFVIV